MLKKLWGEIPQNGRFAVLTVNLPEESHPAAGQAGSWVVGKKTGSSLVLEPSGKSIDLPDRTEGLEIVE